MITGEIKSKIDAVWNDFWSGGISNPLEVMEQLTYLLFIKGLDEAQNRADNKANATGQPDPNPIFPEGIFTPDEATAGRPYSDLRWGKFKSLPPKEMYEVVGRYVFPFMQTRSANSSHATHMAGARLTIPTPLLLQKAVDGLDALPMKDRDTKGDVYEYMLSKIATAGQNGQFRTPRHIIQLMVEMMAPTPTDTICDPASGTCGFLVAAGEHVREAFPTMFGDPANLRHFHHKMFNGYDFDNTMLRIGSMNLQLHGVENPNIVYKDSLAQEHADDIEAYSLVLANPPFAGSLDYESTAKDLLQVVKTKKTELLFLALFLRLLKPGGRAAVSTASCRCPPACSSRTRACPPPSCCSPKPTRAAPMRCGSTTCRRMGAAWTISARRCWTNPSSGPRPPSPQTSTPRTTCPTRWPAGSTVMAPNEAGPAPTSRSACPRPTSPTTDMT